MSIDYGFLSCDKQKTLAIIYKIIANGKETDEVTGILTFKECYLTVTELQLSPTGSVIDEIHELCVRRTNP